MKFAVIQFPGSNCDQDCLAALRGLEGAEAEYVWHKETSLEGFDAIVLPGGFSYGDYLRCGAIARFSPIMAAVVEKARAGMLVIGICNGFQILCEAGLLPGASGAESFAAIRLRNGDDARGGGELAVYDRLRRKERCCGCRWRTAKVAFLPTRKHCGELNANRQVMLRYANAAGRSCRRRIQMVRWKTSRASAIASGTSLA